MLPQSIRSSNQFQSEIFIETDSQCYSLKILNRFFYKFLLIKEANIREGAYKVL